MIRSLILAGLAAGTMLSACAPYEATPTSPIQWQRRQEAIEQREAERVQRCATMNKDSERHARECPGDPS